jgi:hypothetical protein
MKSIKIKKKNMKKGQSDLLQNCIAITWRPASVSKLFQKSSPLKPLGQFKANLT